jgi:hypothetical protein
MGVGPRSETDMYPTDLFLCLVAAVWLMVSLRGYLIQMPFGLGDLNAWNSKVRTTWKICSYETMNKYVRSSLNLGCLHPVACMRSGWEGFRLPRNWKTIEIELRRRPSPWRTQYVGFEVFTAVTIKNTVICYVEPCGSRENWRFGGTCHLHRQNR